MDGCRKRPSNFLTPADGFFIIACGNDSQFGALCGVCGLAGLPNDERFATNAARVRNRPALLASLEGVVARRPVSEWVTALERAGVPCGPIFEVDQALEQPHTKAGVVRTVGAALGFGCPTFTTRPPPLLGQHAEEVLRDVLGMDDAAIAGARNAGALGTRQC